MNINLEILEFIHNLVNKIILNDKRNLVIQIKSTACIYSLPEYEKNNSILYINEAHVIKEEPNNTYVIDFDKYTVTVPFEAITYILDLNLEKSIHLNENSVINIANIPKNLVNNLKNLLCNVSITNIYNKADIINFINNISNDVNKHKINFHLIAIMNDINDIEMSEDNDNRQCIYIQSQIDEEY